MTNRTKWTEYTGSDEQIAEMINAENGFTFRTGPFNETSIWHNIINIEWYKNEITHYLICKPHPLVDMIIRQAQTGQPVWIRTNPFDWDVSVPSHYETTTPDWNIPNAEYSFTEFKEEA